MHWAHYFNRSGYEAVDMYEGGYLYTRGVWRPEVISCMHDTIGPKKGAEKRKNFSCEGCPSASLCGKVACSENAELVMAAEESTLVGNEQTEKEDK